MFRRVALLVALFALVTVPSARALEPNDVAFAGGLQWGLERIGAPDAWDTSTGDGITIAVIDSGADLTHEDLRRKIVDSTSCFDTDGDPDACRGDGQDDHGHGTHVTGIAGASTNNGAGIAGVAPGADLMIVRVLERDGSTASGQASDVSAGIRWAVDNGADIVNLSLGSTTNTLLSGVGLADVAFEEAINYAWDNDVIAVIAAGNDFVLSSGFADEPAVVVSATNRDDRAASYSSGVGQAQWGLAAPGGEGGDDGRSCGTGGSPRGILSTYWTPDTPNQYACLAGTSMSAPHVSGALAVLRSMGATPIEAVQHLLTTAVDLGPSGRDATFGAGRIDLAAAVEAAKVNPASTTTAPPSGGGPSTSAAAAVPGDDAAGGDPTGGSGSGPTGDPTSPAADGTPSDDPGELAGPGGPSGEVQAGPTDAAIGDLEVSLEEVTGRAGAPLQAAAGALAFGVGATAAVLTRRGTLTIS